MARQFVRLPLATPSCLTRHLIPAKRSLLFCIWKSNFNHPDRSSTKSTRKMSQLDAQHGVPKPREPPPSTYPFSDLVALCSLYVRYS